MLSNVAENSIISENPKKFQRFPDQSIGYLSLLNEVSIQE